MDKKPYWIWKYGDFEIYHSMRLHMRRVEREVVYPPYWKVDAPTPKVMFYCNYEGEGGYIRVHANGDGYVKIGNALYSPGSRISLGKGKFTICACIIKEGGFPAIFVESDVIPSGEGWYVKENNHSERVPVGFDKYYDSPEKNPAVFHFEYESTTPVRAEAMEGGMLYDFGKETFGYLLLAGTDPAARLCVYYGESEEEALDAEDAQLTETVTGAASYRLRQRAFQGLLCLSECVCWKYLRGSRCPSLLRTEPRI
jgi:hypothetical protein